MGPGALIGFRSPFEGGCTPPFIVNAIKRTTVLTLELSSTRHVLNLLDRSEADVVAAAVRKEDDSICNALTKKDTKVNTGADAKKNDANKVGEVKIKVAQPKKSCSSLIDVERIQQLEVEVSNCV